MRIGLLSDTHGFMDKNILMHFKTCDEVWHAGDWGSLAVAGQLQSQNKLRGVHGNIDSTDIVKMFPRHISFQCEQMKILIIHIGGTPSHYSTEAKELISGIKPDVFICGHSHMLKVMKDHKNNLLYMNPGACGLHGNHLIRTLMRFTIQEKKISGLEVIELGKRAIRG